MVFLFCMKNIFFFLILILFPGFCLRTENENIFNDARTKQKTIAGKASTLIDHQKFQSAILYCRKQKLDTNIAFFLDMSIHSGKNRFFVVDLQAKKIINSGLVCHGMGKGSTGEQPVFLSLIHI